MNPSKIFLLPLFAVIFLLSSLFGLTATAAGEPHPHTDNPMVDSLRNVIVTTSMTDLVKIYPQIHNTLYSINDIDTHLELNTVFAEAAKTAKNLEAQALASGFRVEIMTNYKMPDSAILAEANRALDFMREVSGAEAHYFYTSTIVADTYIMSGNFEDALRVAEGFYEEAKQRGNDSGIAASLQSMGKAYDGLELYDKAEESFREGLRFATEKSGAGIKCETYHLLVVVLNQMGKFSEALEVCKEFEAFLDLRETFSGIPGEVDNIRFVNNLAYAQTYTNLGQYGLAAEHILRAETYPPYGTAHGILMVEEIRFELLLKEGQYADAKRSLDRAEDSVGEEGTYYEKLRLKKKRASLYHLWGRYDLAADNYKEYITRNDSLQRVDMAEKLHSLRTRYEVDKLEMQKELQSQMIARQKNTITFIGFVLLLVVTAMGIITQLYRKKKNAYRSLAEKARLWAVKGESLMTADNGPEQVDREIATRLEEYITTHKPYLEPDLTLDTLAERMQVGKAKLSRAINRVDGNTFKQYLGDLRVKEAIRLMDKKEYDGLSLGQLMEDAGFNSRSSFYESFTKATGLTPAQYWKNRKSLTKD